MLTLCFWLLSVAVLLGGLLAAGRARRWSVPHGVSGGLGCVALALALWQGRLAQHELAGPLAWDAGALAAAALVGGLCLAFVWPRARRPALVVFLHGFAGGLAYLLLAGVVLGR